MKIYFKIFLLAISFNCIFSFCFCQSADEYNKYGYYRNKAKEYDSGIYFFNKAIKLNPNNASFYIGRGYSETRLKKYSEAMDDFRNALSLDSNNAIAYYNMACIYSLKKDTKNAFLFLKKAAAKWTYEYDDFSETLKTDSDLNFVRKQKEFPRFLRKYSPSQ